MKKNNIFTFFDDIERNDETLKKWGDLYRVEKELIETIVKTRKIKGLSQKQLAEMTGLKQPAIARIENSTNSPQLDTIIKIADALELKLTLNNQRFDFNQILFSKLTEFREDIESYYIRVISNIQPNNVYDYQGGMYYENQPHQHPCKENHPA